MIAVNHWIPPIVDWAHFFFFLFPKKKKPEPNVGFGWIKQRFLVLFYSIWWARSTTLVCVSIDTLFTHHFSPLHLASKKKCIKESNLVGGLGRGLYSLCK